MLPEFLIPEATVREAGTGPEIFIGRALTSPSGDRAMAPSGRPGL